MKSLFSILLTLFVVTANAQVENAMDGLVGTWSGRLEFENFSLRIVFHFHELNDGTLKCAFDSPDQNAQGIPAHIIYHYDDSVRINITKIGALYEARHIEGEITGRFKQNGINLPLTITKEVNKPNRPQTPSLPLPYRTENVTFTNAVNNVILNGTLTYPVGYEKMNKRQVPVVLMVSGSGIQNRDEELFEHKPFFVIADYLARNGIASLRYDDRDFDRYVSGKQINSNVTTQDYKRDAHAGINFLRKTKNFGNIGVIGHSEGGNIAFMLATEKLADFIISMAAIGVKADSALTAQVNKIIELQGRKTIKMSIEQYRYNVSTLNNTWLNWFINYNPRKDIVETRCPVMAINGEKDCQVICDLNLKSIEKILPKHKDNFIKAYPNLNHLFQHCQTGLPNEYSTIEETISPEVLNDITKWIHRLPK